MTKENPYKQKRPFRYQTDGNRFFLELMEKRFSRPFTDIWERFGYEIGGPVCYSYVRWLMEEIEEDQEISSIAFVARDGWLLKPIYEKLTAGKGKPARYVYASRSICLRNQSNADRNEYGAYLDSLGLTDGTIAVVDTVTMKFSSQRLISGDGCRKTKGFFWVVLSNQGDFGREFRYRTYQEKRHHILLNWNIIEFILTSPEPPIEAFQRGQPIYSLPDESEKFRERLFPSLSKGVFEFMEDVCRGGGLPQISNQDITEWVNGYLRHPDEDDKEAFSPIRFSERGDHADSILLDPFGLGRRNMLKLLKARLWFWSQDHRRIYAVLRWGNQTLKRLVGILEGRGVKRFDGRNMKIVLDAAADADVVSFDIFDTLLLRPYPKPTGLFRALEQDSGLFDFYDNRIRAEQFARATAGKRKGEVNILDIYQPLSKRYGIDAGEFANREIEKELDVCYPNPHFLPIVRELARLEKPMIATSDMYLPSSVLRRLLDKNGLSAIDRIFVSNEYGAGKYDGSLQTIVWETVGSEKKVLHIGDNFESDVKKSRDVGWVGIWYRRRSSEETGQ